ncbi:MAG TPA: serine/threonine-protein kinase [Phycisphaerae bacterium]|nr:serine/threonine-protein kinase [Phycisphaerae bacterium]
MADVVSGYNILSKLGEGARSQVYQVVHPSTGQVFAVKRVLREAGEDTRYLDQAINEYNIAAKMRHPTLRKAFELKRIRKLLRLVEIQVFMEFVDGTSLDKARPARLERTVEIFLRVGDGLQAMHDEGFLHADIKPNNILLAYKGDVRIIDFGQCCEIGFRKPRIQGTPDYIAPEQVERLELTPQTDIFNFGATLYWALTGQTFATVLAKGKKKAEPRKAAPSPEPATINQDVPRDLSRLIMECCEHNRADRPRTMKDVLARLGAFLPPPARGKNEQAAPSAARSAAAPSDIEN